MPFMIPEYTKEPFLSGETVHGEGDDCPLSAWMSHAAIKRNDVDALRKAMDLYAEEHNLKRDSIEITHNKWWARLSAPGYTDCTEWMGPFNSLGAAQHEVREFYEVHPESGEDLTDDDTPSQLHTLTDAEEDYLKEKSARGMEGYNEP